MKIIGLTGGIATGKSTVVRRIESTDGTVVIIDCDKIAREVVEPGTSGFDALHKEFGGEDGVFVDDGHRSLVLDRKKLGKIVFADDEKRKRLVRITGPRIMRALAMKLLYHWLVGTSFVIVDAPTLYETKSMVQICAMVIVIATNPEIELARLMSRDGIPEEEARQKIGAQMPISEKVARADKVLWNNDSQKELEAKTDEVIKELHARYDYSISRLFSGPGIALLVLISVGAALLSRQKQN